jgi:hypothetical protein
VLLLVAVPTVWAPIAVVVVRVDVKSGRFLLLLLLLPAEDEGDHRLVLNENAPPSGLPNPITFGEPPPLPPL